jgi:hypothetical protein
MAVKQRETSLIGSDRYGRDEEKIGSMDRGELIRRPVRSL